MTGGNGHTVTWTAANMAASIVQGTTTVAFNYDADHARMSRTMASASTYYFTDPGLGIKVENKCG